MAKKSIPLKSSNNRPRYCPHNKELVIAGRDKSGVTTFKKFIHALPQTKTLNKAERMVAWSLFQMNLRPDLATPSARFQILTNLGPDIQFWDFRDASLERDLPKSSPPVSFIFGLESILKAYSPSSSLREIAKLLDKYLPQKIPISLDFAHFIEQNKARLTQNKVFSRAFFKAGEELHYGESITKISYLKLIKKYNKIRNSIAHEVSVSKQLYSYNLPSPSSKSSKMQALCNIDMKEYEKNIYKINSENIERHHPFAMQYEDGSFFIGITSIAKRNWRTQLDTFLIETVQDKTIAPLCYTKSKDGTYAYLSFKGRDPGQHLYNLFQYNMHGASSSAELDQFLKFPRHLILENPIRLFYESERSNNKNLSRFLENDIPVYHARSLGEVWIYSSNSGFILDDRGRAHLSCMN